MPLLLISAPEEEPITLEEARNHLRQDSTDDDEVIWGLVVAARLAAEDCMSRVLMPQTWELYLDGFPCVIQLPKPPLSSVTFIKYIDVDGQLITLDQSMYKVDNISKPARIVPAYNEQWPSTRCEINAVTVRFVAGVATDQSSISQNIKNAIKLHMEAHYTKDLKNFNLLIKAFESSLYQDLVHTL